MASINFPPGDLHAFIKHEEEIGRDVFLSRSLIIFTLTGQTGFFALRTLLISINGRFFLWYVCKLSHKISLVLLIGKP